MPHEATRKKVQSIRDEAQKLLIQAERLESTIISRTFSDEDDFQGAYEYMQDHADENEMITLQRHDGIRKTWTSKDVFGNEYGDDYDDIYDIIVNNQNLPRPAQFRLVLM